MKIWAYVTVWNEEKMLPYYLRHYSQFCERIIVFDNESTDNTVGICEEWPMVEVRTYSTDGTFNDYKHLNLKHDSIEEARGNCDYVIISDCDEFIYHPNLFQFLKEHLNKTAVFYPAGFQMASYDFPETDGQIYDIIKTGEPSPWYSKPILLNPNMISDLYWVEGCHEIENGRLTHSGNIYHVVPDSVRPNGPYKEHQWGNWKIMFDLLHIFDKEPLKLLHYKFLGANFVHERYKQYVNRISDVNKAAGLAKQYENSNDLNAIQSDINSIIGNSVTLSL